MSARSKARKRALDILFEADQRSIPVADVVADRRSRSASAQDPGYAVELAEGVVSHAEEIDALLTRFATDWPLDRMPAVDRAALRLGTYELRHAPDVPSAVVINEWVELVKQLSTDDSPGFVNAMLGRIVTENGAHVVPPVGFEPTNPAV